MSLRPKAKALGYEPGPITEAKATAGQSVLRDGAARFVRDEIAHGVYTRLHAAFRSGVTGFRFSRSAFDSS